MCVQQAGTAQHRRRAHTLPPPQLAPQTNGIARRRRPSWSSEQGCCTLTSPLDRSVLGCDTGVPESACLVPRDVFRGSDAEFIWAADLERDNRVLFRHTARCGRG